MADAVSYTRKERVVALVYGVATHLLFVLAVGLMAVSIFQGLTNGRGSLTGWSALAGNSVLILQFPLLHSWLLNARGRRLLVRLSPGRLGPVLSTTVFAAISSLQLILVFVFWSPSNHQLWIPSGAIGTLMIIAYALSWLMLMQAMREAGLPLQSGSLGWRAVWRQAKPRYPGLPTGILHRQIRQPIYAAFALILWTSPVWSLEKIIFALIWSAYCVVGSTLKERRFMRIHGEAFERYQQRVPFWIPRWLRWTRATAQTPRMPSDAEVVIVGAGPVGLLLANLLGQAGRSVIVLEAAASRAERSMAIGITPPSLDILAGLGLHEDFIRRGVKITDAFVHEDGITVDHLKIDELPDPYNFILSLPQVETTRLLREKLKEWSSVKLMTGWRVTGVEQAGQRVATRATDPIHAIEHTFHSELVAGCDGARSQVATWMGIRMRTKQYRPQFIMADFKDASGLAQQAHLFFGHERPVESFPLPDGRRRWIVRSGWKNRTDLSESMASAVFRLTGILLRQEDWLDQSNFQPQRRLASRFYRGRVALCGDAAHVMSPIGGQGMNTGFGDAAFLARSFDAILGGRGSVSKCLRAYSRHRRFAFRLAAARSALGMKLGVTRGPVASLCRRAAVAWLLRHRGARHFLARWFTMRSLPHPVRQAEAAGL